MKGFSLLEIMVSVAIIAIMASSVVIGFGSFEETVRTQETAGVIKDTAKNLELEMIRREYVKQTIHFEKEFLVSEAQVEGQNLTLEWKGQGGCPQEEDELKITHPNPGSPVYLARRDQYGNNLEINAYTANEDVCVDFMDSEETEWQYQLFTGSDRSQVIRFIHFNIRRSDDSGLVEINSGADSYKLELTAPYASKQFYENDIPFNNTITVTVQNGGEPQDLTLQE